MCVDKIKNPQTAIILLFADFICDPEGTRTPNLLGRNQVLYPIKLRDHGAFFKCGANIQKKAGNKQYEEYFFHA